MVTYSDFIFPLRPDFQLCKDENVIVQNIQQLILTAKMELISDPELGVGIEEFIFDSLPIKAIQETVRRQIKDYIPQIQLTYIEVVQEGTHIKCFIEGSLLQFGMKQVAFEFEA